MLPVGGILILATWVIALGQTDSPSEDHLQTEVAIKGKIAFVSNRPGNSPWIIRGDKILSIGERSGRSQFSPDGNLLFLVTDRGWAQLDLRTGEKKFFSKERRQMVTSDFAWSPDGQKICFTATEQKPSEGLNGANIHIENVDGTGLRCLTNFPPIYPHGAMNPTWSLDGKSILFTAFDPSKAVGQEGVQFWIIDITGSNLRKIRGEVNNYSVNEPAWSPDGSKIAFVSYEPNDPGDYELYVCNIDGSGVRRLTKNNWNERRPTFSPDGKQICFVSYRHEPMGMAGLGSELFIINVDGSKEKRLTPPQKARRNLSEWTEDDYPTWGP